MADLSPAEQKTAVSLVSDQSKSTRSNLKRVAATGDAPNVSAPQRQKATKAKEALSDAVNKPYVQSSAVESRIENIKKAATVHRLPGETIGGSGFYFQHRGEVDQVLKGSDVSLPRGLDATSKLSVRTRPEAEKESFGALVKAHQSGSVHFSPELVGALQGIKGAKGQPASIDVPEEHLNKVIPFSKVSPKIAAGLTDPQVRDVAKAHTSGVQLDSLAKTAIRGNIANAHNALQGKTSSPYDNPKQVSYASAHDVSLPGTKAHEEYQVRSQHIGKTLRGEVPPGQQLFDYTGLQHSNEGALSNTALTPADLHERRVAYAQPGKAFAAAPDANGVSSKSRTLPSGKKQTVGAGDTRITPIGIEHAVHQEAVHQTAKKLQEDLSLPHTVPATLVQETNWAGTRREEGDDPQYNAVRRNEVASNRSSQFKHTRLF
jgi:hypothetical protein